MSTLNISISRNIRRKVMLMLRLSSLAHKLLMFMFMPMLASQVRTGKYQNDKCMFLLLFKSSDKKLFNWLFSFSSKGFRVKQAISHTSFTGARRVKPSQYFLIDQHHPSEALSTSPAPAYSPSGVPWVEQQQQQQQQQKHKLYYFYSPLQHNYVFCLSFGLPSSS